MDPNNAIELRNVSLSYQIDVENTEKGIFKKNKNKVENCVLDNLNLDVKKGEILGILGTNGAGKSTLLSIIAKIQEPDSGSVEINGKIATILELGMGFHQDLTGRENIILKGELYGFSKKQMESKLNEIIDYSGIRKYIDNPVRTYSSGMRSRLAFSVMIHVDAEIMLVDEILSTGDAAFSAKASDFFKKLLKDGKTVVYVSHAPGAVESICSRAIWLDKGKIIADGKPKKICAQYLEATLDSLDVVMDQAKSGVANAQYRLAMFYKEGINVEQNYESYINWLALAAEQGHIKAQTEYADYLMESEVTSDRDLAMSYYQSSAVRGDIEAKTKLALLQGNDYYSKEYNELKSIFKKMAEMGNPTDMYRYAIFLFKMSFDREEKEESFYWFKKVAEEFNHPDAILQLAAMYRDGIGVRKNKAKYIETIKKGHELGIVKATNILADIYATGLLVEEDMDQALKLYEQCAERGSIPCQYTVANMYQEGKGTEVNFEKSKYWFEMYSKSQLISYQLAAITILKNNEMDFTITINELYDEIKNTTDTKGIIELINRLHETPRSQQIENDLSSLYNRLSFAYGKGMALAYNYYSNVDSIGYDEEKTYEILNKCLYLEDPALLFRYAYIELVNRKTKQRDLAIKCMKIAAKKKNIDAINYCKEHNIKTTGEN